MIKLFNQKWNEVTTVWVDVETTGIRPGVDRAVSVGLAKFVAGELDDGGGSLINPGIPIPPEATAIHGITDEMVRGKPTIEEFFAAEEQRAWLAGDIQFGAYNASFDRHFLPPTIAADWTWPWLDTLSWVRVVDRYARGQGRHKLTAACERHGVSLLNAHSAVDDACAAGALLYKVLPKLEPIPGFPHPNSRALTVGHLLRGQREQEAGEWYRFNEWLAKQPPREPDTAGAFAKELRS